MDAIEVRWHKSSYSGGNGGDCVEIGERASRVLVRDTKDRRGPVLTFSPEAWQRFSDQVKAHPSAVASVWPSDGCKGHFRI
jgi:hypothetical protein